MRRGPVRSTRHPCTPTLKAAHTAHTHTAHTRNELWSLSHCHCVRAVSFPAGVPPEEVGSGSDGLRISLLRNSREHKRHQMQLRAETDRMSYVGVSAGRSRGAPASEASGVGTMLIGVCCQTSGTVQLVHLDHPLFVMEPSIKSPLLSLNAPADQTPGRTTSLSQSLSQSLFRSLSQSLSQSPSLSLSLSPSLSPSLSFYQLPMLFSHISHFPHSFAQMCHIQIPLPRITSPTHHSRFFS